MTWRTHMLELARATKHGARKFGAVAALVVCGACDRARTEPAPTTHTIAQPPPSSPSLSPSSEEEVTELSMGALHACAVKRQELWCWGLLNSAFPNGSEFHTDVIINSSTGESTAPSLRPARLQWPEPVRDVAVTDRGTCVLSTSGRVQCTGLVAWLLTHRSHPPGSYEVELPLPVPLRTLEGADDGRFCGRSDAGHAYCWGPRRDIDEPIEPVVGPDGAQPIEFRFVGADVGIDAAGHAYVWFTDAGRIVAQRVPSSEPFESAMREFWGVALRTTDGRVEAWRDRDSLRRTEEQLLPPGVPVVRQIDCFDDWCCGIDLGHRLRCWGLRFDLFTDWTGRPAYEPEDRAAWVRTGPQELCFGALEPGHPVYCWGPSTRWSGSAHPDADPLATHRLDLD